MRFSFLTVVIALTASIMSVGACKIDEDTCTKNSDCCNKKSKCVSVVSKSSLFCIQLSPDDSPVAPCDISRMVLTSAIAPAIDIH
ncbi:hypothetical protein EDB19DRAFT_575466 [Suillus lakei]|nr:hypothetical protein EDB19DRAFT_575466 [Suillus lakei]